MSERILSPCDRRCPPHHYKTCPRCDQAEIDAIADRKQRQMAKSADMVMTAHLNLEIKDGANVAEEMMEVTRLIERLLSEAAAQGKLETDNTRVMVGKVLGAGVPR